MVDGLLNLQDWLGIGGSGDGLGDGGQADHTGERSQEGGGQHERDIVL